MNTVYGVSSMDIDQNSDFLPNLVAKAKLGQEEAFGSIYNLYFEKIYRFIYYRVSHKEIAEDLAEEVFLKAFSKLSSIQNNESFEGWLYQIARNKVIDYYRDKKELVNIDEVENTLTYDSNILDVLELQENQKILLELLKELAPDQQMVIKMKFLEDLDNDKISQVMKKKEGAIRVIQHRAITKLQELMKKFYGKN